ncbi:hypothetical protein [Streptomyces formicae]|uniref:Mce-associated membrane protein n=1 Tax=Streptomyces formicae TaxID=1616117 RepID=A0ABY3WIZ5_9ACTN|nr:hypothetical protein [Streptomyces formicae]UNM12541.1 hypothetical protein J4032_14285 [Streptomyces formicae]
MTYRTKAMGWVAIALAVLFCAYGGWSYAQARDDGATAYATARDAALTDGRRHVAGLSTADARSPQESLRTWLSASTGPLRDQLRKAGAPSGTAARATVTDAALTSLDDRAGTAELIATLRVELTPAGGRRTTDRKRLEATLTRTADGWKVSELGAVPVGAP